MKNINYNSDDSLFSLNLLKIIKDKILILVLISIIGLIFLNFILNYHNKKAYFTSVTKIENSKNLNFEIENISKLFKLIKEDDPAYFGLFDDNIFKIYLNSMNEELILKNIEDADFINREDFVEENDFQEALIDIYRNNFKLIRKTGSEVIGNNSIESERWFIEYTGPIEQLQKWSNFLIQFNIDLSNATRKSFVTKVKNHIENINFLIDVKVSTLVRKKEFILKENYEYKTQELLLYLSEQAAIARKLGISNGISYILESTQNADNLSLTDTRGEDYLSFQWGYLAIETKINDILSRSNNNTKYFSREYFGIDNEIFLLKNRRLFCEELFKKIDENLTIYENRNISENFININSTKIKTNLIGLKTKIILFVIFVILINIIYIFFALSFKKIKT